MRIALATATLVVCAAAGLVVDLQAQSRTSAAANSPSAARATPKAQPKLSDAQLESAIRSKFGKSKSASSFTVRVQGGVATIEGKTDIVQHKAAATRMAKTAGAVAVHNRVLVSEAAKKRAAGNLEEGRRRAQVKRGDLRDGRK